MTGVSEQKRNFKNDTKAVKSSGIWEKVARRGGMFEGLRRL